MSRRTYRFGLLLLLFGGFLSLNSTGLFADIGVGVAAIGFLIGMLGLVNPGESTDQSG